MEQKKETSLLAEDDWRGWLQQRPTQEFLAGIVAKLKWMKDRAASGGWSNKENADSTQFENGAGLGYIKALKDVLINGDVLPDVIADEMPEVVKRLGVTQKDKSDVAPTLLCSVATQNESISVLGDYGQFLMNVTYTKPRGPFWSRIRNAMTGFGLVDEWFGVDIDLSKCDIAKVKAFAETLLRIVKSKS